MQGRPFEDIKAGKIAEDHFHRNDISTPYHIRQTIHTLEMMDPADVSNFIGQHVFLRKRILGMGVYTEDEAVFRLLWGLPATPVWQQFKLGLIHRISVDHHAFVRTTISSSSTESNPFAPWTFESCAACIIAEASRLVDMQTIAPSSRPESEYAHAERAVRMGPNANPITGLPKHKHNPGGVLCTTPGCGKGDHDHNHCFAKGGGMEGQAPRQRKKRKKLTGTNAAAVPATSVSDMIPASAAPANPAAPITLISCASTDSTFSPPILPSPPGIAARVLSTILDCSTSLTLIRDREFFWSYSTADPVTVRTANSGHLAISGRGDCLAWLTINGNRHRVRLTNCLHAPDTMVNILSVGWMVTKGWGCNFRGKPPRCELVYRGTPLGNIPMSGGLFFVDLTLICPEPESTSLPPQLDVFAFANVAQNLDLSHTCIGGDAVKDPEGC
ncbi:hypothetical protein EDB19DRAFT_1904240 [Suillus lakei]|nr:hypothetical protein EDB19DRAFT_1904240 [Suillus lakei]